MRYLLHALRCLVVGVTAALGALVVALLVILLLDVVVFSVAAGERVRAMASGELGAVSASLAPVLAAMMVGFVAGFRFMLGKHEGRRHRE